ncbi:MAG: putative glycolipid-binding domain-containing protein [Gemmatimonadales bacterium]|jgi:uncharacterized protein
MTQPGRTLLWRRLDQPGHEAARLVFHEPFWQLSGMAVFAYQDQACRLEYAVVCDAAWQTRHAWVVGWVGLRHVRVDLLVTADRRWHLDGRAQPELGGCEDIDLAFSPSTNMLAIRRLGLAPGQGRSARAAWLAFPAFQLEPLEQTYRRTGEGTYRYEADGAFSTELEVDKDGFVRRYPGRWELEPM